MAAPQVVSEGGGGSGEMHRSAPRDGRLRIVIRATVLIPSHNHGRLLELSSSSVLAQTIGQLELFIVLDGADDPTRAAALSVAADDNRVRVFDNPKGERFGEAHRHTALAEATGTIVAYLGDDDLWFPDHLEYVETLLDDADFANSLVVHIDPDGAISAPALDLTHPFHRRGLFADGGFSLSVGAHTLAAYRSLGVGWHPAPEWVNTDVHMWRHFAADPSVRMVSGGRPTAIHLGSPARTGMSAAERFEEHERWASVLRDPASRDRLRLDMFEYLNRRRAFHLREIVALQGEKAALLESAASKPPPLKTRRLKKALKVAKRRLKKQQRELDRMRNSVSYRATQRIASMPVVGAVGRALARGLLRGASSKRGKTPSSKEGGELGRE